MNPQPLMKARENRVARAAKCQGMTMVKSRRRDPNADGFGKYVVVESSPSDSRDVATRMLNDGDGLSLDAVEAFLNWNDVHLQAPEATPNEDDSNRVLVFKLSVGEWEAFVMNDGRPIDRTTLAEKEHDAVEQAKMWAKKYFVTQEGLYRNH